MAINKQKRTKLGAEKISNFFSAEKKFRDLVAFGPAEKASLAGLNLLVAAAGALADFYGGHQTPDLKTAARELFLIKLPEAKKFVSRFLEIESLKRAAELGSRKFEPAAAGIIISTAEDFLEWVKKMIPGFSEGFEF